MKKLLLIFVFTSVLHADTIDVLCIGQSNMTGQGEGPYVTRASDQLYMWIDGGLDTLADPTGYYGIGASGSMLPAMANEIWLHNQDDVIRMLNISLPSNGFIKWSERGSGTLYQKSIDTCNAMTGDTLGPDYIVSMMGEAEATGGAYQVVRSHLENLIDDYRAEWDTNIVFVSVEIGKIYGVTADTYVQNVRRAIKDADPQYKGTRTFWVSALDVEDTPEATGHLTQNALNIVGRRAGNAINYHRGQSQYWRAPYINRDSVFISADSTQISFQIVGALSYGPQASNLTGLVVSDGEDVKTPDSLNLTDSLVTAYFSDTITGGGYTINYLQQGVPDITNPIYGNMNADDSTLGLESDFFSVGQQAAKSLFFGVCPNVPADFKDGSPTITITDGEAEFSVAQTDSLMGIGAKITYNTNSTCYVSGKISNTIWTVTTNTGATPTDVVGQTVNTITHPYTTMNDAKSASLLIGGQDITQNGIASKVFLCLYKYDTDETATSVSFDNLITDPNYYVTIYAPRDTLTECNISQKGGVVWDSTKATWRGTGTLFTTGAMAFTRNFVVDGIQFDINASGTSVSTAVSTKDSTSFVVFRNCKFMMSSNGNVIYAINPTIAKGSQYSIYNNLFFAPSVSASGSYVIYSNGPDTNSVVNIYNNTVYGVHLPMRIIGSRQPIVNIKNNAFIGNTVANAITTSGTINKDYNMYDVNEGESNGTLTTQTDSALFASTTGDTRTWNWGPLNTSSDLVDNGTDLDLYYSQDMVNDSGYRPLINGWDCGAFEYAPGVTINSITPDTSGVPDTIEISGTGFLNQQKTGIVIFANDTLDNEYISWNDTLIVVKLPSGVSSVDVTVINSDGSADTAIDGFTYATSQPVILTPVDTTKWGIAFEVSSTIGFQVVAVCSTFNAEIQRDTLSMASGLDTVTVNDLCYDVQVNCGVERIDTTAYIQMTTLNQDLPVLTLGRRSKNTATRFPALLMSTQQDSCNKVYKGDTLTNIDVPVYHFNLGGETTSVSYDVDSKINRYTGTGIWFLQLDETETSTGSDSILEIGPINANEIMQSRIFRMLME